MSTRSEVRSEETERQLNLATQQLNQTAPMVGVLATNQGLQQECVDALSQQASLLLPDWRRSSVLYRAGPPAKIKGDDPRAQATCMLTRRSFRQGPLCGRWSKEQDVQGRIGEEDLTHSA